MRISILISILLLSAGCRDHESASETGVPKEIAAISRMAILESRIKVLESEVKSLRIDQLHIKNLATTNIIINARADDNTNTESITFNAINDMVASALEQRIGTPHQIETIFEETIQDQMAAYEQRKGQIVQEEIERKREEEKQRREERDQQREKELQEREKRRFETYASVLNINENDYTRLREIENQTRQTMYETIHKMREDGGYTPKNYEEAMIYIKSQHDESLRQILSGDQLNTYKEQYGTSFSYGGHMGGRFR